MNPHVRNRILMPILIPLAVLGAMVALIGTFALLLLFNDHYGALTLAAVAAGAVLFSVALATSNDRLGRGRGAVVIGAAALPLLVGGAVAAGVVGGLEDEDRNINAQPLLIVPEDAPVIAAQDSADFCLPDDGGCETTDRWEVVPSAEVDTVAFVFDNREAGVPHNVVITELEGSEDDPQPGTAILASEVVTGEVEDYYVDDNVTWDDLPEQWYFFCAVHPGMNGVGQLAEG